MNASTSTKSTQKNGRIERICIKPSESRQNVSIMTIGDPHFKVKNVPETVEMTERCFKLAKERKPDAIICLGDILDRHESIHVRPLMNAVNFLKRLAEISPTILLIGNHDRPNNADYLSPNHPFTALKGWPNLWIIDITSELIIKGHRMILVPYVPNGRFMYALNILTTKDKTPLDGTTCIFAHQEFFGCKMGAIKSIGGDKWASNFPLVVSGHIHDWQFLDPNILYAGTPLQHAYGDSHNKTISYMTFYPSEFEPPTKESNKYHYSPIDAPWVFLDEPNDDTTPTKIEKNVEVETEAQKDPNNNEETEEKISYTSLSNLAHTSDDEDGDNDEEEEEDENISLDSQILKETRHIWWREERIDLGLMKRRIFYITPEEVLTFTPPKNILSKLVIRGSAEALRATMKLLKIKDLRNQNVKISYKVIGTDPVEKELRAQTAGLKVTDKRLSYLQRLQFNLEIPKFVGAKEEFIKLFGQHPIETVKTIKIMGGTIGGASSSTKIPTTKIKIQIFPMGTNKTSPNKVILKL